MPRLPYLFRTMTHLVLDAFILLRSNLRSRTVLAAAILFLRKQLALYQERQVKPRRADPATRMALVVLARMIDWKPVLTVVRPDTLIRWHRAGWRLYWRWRSRPRGRPPIPRSLRQLIVSMARANPTWGEERIANELLLKLGIAVSPRTVGRYRELIRPPRRGHPSQRWSTFVRNHAQAVLACDFCVAITASFQLVYVFVVLEVGTRRITHWNVTAHPTAAWTVQQFRTTITGETTHRWLIHDRDAIYAALVDDAVQAMGVTVLKTPARTPQAKDYASYCTSLV